MSDKSERPAEIVSNGNGDRSAWDGDTDGYSRRGIMAAATAAAAAGQLGPSGDDGSTADASRGIPTPWLHVDGNLIKDPNGNTVTLRGVNIADPKRLDVTAPARGKTAMQAVDLVTDPDRDWHARVVRVPVQPVDIGEHTPGHIGGAPEPPAFTQSQLETYLAEHLDPVIERCREVGVYCIVDFHRHWKPVQWAEGQDGPINTTLQEEVTTFWETVAPRYADQSHVLYEVYNEPTEPGMWGDPTETEWVADVWRLWKELAQPWVDTIREHAPDNLVLIGSPSWTQSPEGALVEPFEGENLAYTYHIYPGHNASRQQAWDDASINGEGVANVYEEYPLFVTEFGWQSDIRSRFLRGTVADFGEPFVEWLEQSDAIHWTAWVADPVWLPATFDRPFTDQETVDSIGNPYDDEPMPQLCEELPCEWELLTGEDAGGFIKNTLRDLRNDNVPGGGGGGDDDDTTPPTAPTDLSAPNRSETSVDLSWSAASDDGGSGLDHYEVFVDGTETTTVPAGTTETTVTGLDPGTSYEFTVTAVDAAGNESASSDAITVTTAGDGDDGGSGDALVVNDYDGLPAWPEGNELGKWNGAGGFVNDDGTVEGGALRLEYEPGGWFVEKVNQDVSAYSTLVFRVRGDSGGEETDFVLDFGGVSEPLAALTDDSIGTTVSEVAVDLTDDGIDRMSPGSVRLNFWEADRASGAIEIEEIRLEP